MLSPEGSFFRDFLMNETVQSIDALSRKQVLVAPCMYSAGAASLLCESGKVLRWGLRLQLLGLANRVGLRNARLPLLLPGAAVPALPLAPELTQRDEKQVDNILQLVSFLTGGGSPAGAFRGLSPTVAREVNPPDPPPWPVMRLPAAHFEAPLLVRDEQSLCLLIRAGLRPLTWRVWRAGRSTAACICAQLCARADAAAG